MLKFQIAGAAGGYLLEHLLLESMGAERGGGIFAWANAGGVKSLLEDDAFDEFLLAGSFRLFVGTDSITDLRAVNKLIEISTRRPRLEARAFMSPTSSLFHPKLAWFEHESHLSLIVGSGNLTMGGLRANWEAFTVTHLGGEERRRALADIEDFLTSVTAFLLPITDPAVAARVAQNTGNERTIRTSTTVSSTGAGSLMPAIEEVLVTEFPVTQGRPAQANFKLKDYVDFFGAEDGTHRRVTLRLVDERGNTGEVQSRPTVFRKSRNFSFELDGLKAAINANTGRPIGVFLRISTGEFLYSVVRPGLAGFSELDTLLSAKSTEPSNHMRRARLAPRELATAWPAAPILRVGVPAL